MAQESDQSNHKGNHRDGKENIDDSHMSVSALATDIGRQWRQKEYRYKENRYSIQKARITVVKHFSAIGAVHLHGAVLVNLVAQRGT